MPMAAYLSSVCLPPCVVYCGRQGLHCLSYHLAPPRVCGSRMLKLEADLQLKPRPLDLGVCSGSFPAMPTAQPCVTDSCLPTEGIPVLLHHSEAAALDVVWHTDTKEMLQPPSCAPFSHCTQHSEGWASCPSESFLSKSWEGELYSKNISTPTPPPAVGRKPERSTSALCRNSTCCSLWGPLSLSLVQRTWAVFASVQPS